MNFTDIKEEKFYFIQRIDKRDNKTYTYAIFVKEIEGLEYVLADELFRIIDGKIYEIGKILYNYDFSKNREDEFLITKISEYDTYEEMINDYPEYFI